VDGGMATCREGVQDYMLNELKGWMGVIGTGPTGSSHISIRGLGSSCRRLGSTWRIRLGLILVSTAESDVLP
jgi:hypothetical protein